MTPHGTVQRYRTCRDGAWGACDACKAAQAARMATRRARQRALKAAQERATHRLVSAYPDVFAALVAEELRQEGRCDVVA